MLVDAHGDPVEFSILTNPSNTQRTKIATIIQDDLKQLGIQVHVVPLEFQSIMARLFDSFRTAQYQYIPALTTQQGEQLALTLNAPPSFHNPKSVIVVALPAVEQSQLPPLHAVDPKATFCLRKSTLALPVEGAPLVFSTAYAHDLTLKLTRDDGKTVELPADLRSGAYAMRLRAGDGRGLGEEHVVFFVRPTEPKGRVCFLAPTASYLAYANVGTAFDGALLQAISASTPIFQEVDLDVYKNDVEFGLSTYDVHGDGAGVCYSSYRRPIINFRPKYRAPGIGATWQFPADLSIVAWLDAMKYDYDVLTDEDLHREGVAALKPYRVVLNGTHNEYYSEQMMDATEDYLANGGRLLNLGANSHYWCVGFRDDESWVMEVRKLEAGSRAWQARPGEQYLASTGERGGLWRHRGRPPQKLVGVGFTSEGMDQSVPYRRMPDSYNRSVAWMFEGVLSEVFGSEGLGLGGAAGLEIDQLEMRLDVFPKVRRHCRQKAVARFPSN